MKSEQTSYKQTLNLPKTDFPMKANLTEMEPKILASWKDKNVYGELRRKRKGSPRFILHDGPPYANGDIHIGHALNKILKDIIVKYKTMKGMDAPYVPGWDCHGMPIEHALFEKLGKKKQDIDRVNFREKAKAFALEFVERQKGQFRRLGVFGDWEEPYLTLSPRYEARIIRVFKELYLKGYIYRRKKPVYWCPTCETALAEAEVEYEDRQDTSIYVKFPVKTFPEKLKKAFSGKKVSIVIWTTTPWTLPANRALAFHPAHLYGAFEGDGEVVICLPQRGKALFEKSGQAYYENGDMAFKGREYEGTECENPLAGNLSRVVTAETVNLEEGTGIVHIAPGHGEEDYFIGREHRLDVFSPVDEKGRFTEEVPIPSLKGKGVFEANAEVCAILKKKGVLLYEEKITHSYPHCWRCKEPIIFRATEQWFLDVEKDHLRKRLMEATESVTWTPAYGKNRMQGMLTARPDWCLSRQRYWGTPIPIAYCARCRKVIEERSFFEAVERIFGEEGSDAWFKKAVSDFLPKGFRCACGSVQFEREEDILDVWFDSGVSYEAVLKADADHLAYPASLYLEGSDQHRGWFQVSLIPAVANDGKPPYEQVLTHGFVMDGEGLKMSKSRGNVISPQEVIEKFGADVLRLWVFSSQYGEDVRISDEILQRTAEAYRKIRNTFRYLLGNLYDFRPEDAVEVSKMLGVDRWALSKLSGLIREVTNDMEAFSFHKAYQDIYRFCVVEMSSFYLDILKDRLYTLSPGSLNRRSAQTALYHILNSLTGMLSPVLSFTSEEVSRYRDKKEELLSVHHGHWPEAKAEWFNPELEKEWEILLSLREGVLKAVEAFRMEGKCGSSLETSVHLILRKGSAVEWLERKREELMMLLIVSEVTFEKAATLPPGAESTPEGVSVQVRRSSGKKCQRCWNWRTTVGNASEYPDLCDRCVAVMKTVVE